ncbi:hypothetical protein NEUTE1DRAFT_124278 [Neurospora tetrasperma FGSC 2508]|uniref:Uncharacterized protein n=1 Tax=Neurospora tetrasperma (strain FGSC 2508 / ATCC MYA-4615 / P0657) TaxID=510951 RepID=F8MT14_NEUT8|nr:uncharacterized protein NEUTE1DRAFT_124278 [Neurospora tetrasperma FGSC 2508]EGO55996.1 hypothetical protein NEUTE1DRAFT_124278 [Neurospora tetrasperma FGSC 2508]
MSGDSTKQSWAFQGRGWLKTLIAERHEVETFDSRGVTFSGSSSPIRSEDFAAPSTLDEAAV